MAIKYFSPNFKIAGVAACTNLAAFWLCAILLTALTSHLTLWQFLGLTPVSSATKAGETGLIVAFGILGAPASLLLERTGGNHVILLMTLCSLLNAVIWGVGLGVLSGIIRMRFQNLKSPLTAPES